MTFDSRHSTTRARHSTFDDRQSDVGRRFAAVGCRLSNVKQPTITETYQPDQVSVVVQVEIEEDAATTQENVDVAPKDAVKNAVKPSGDAVKDAVKNAVKESDAALRENVIEKCAELYCFLRVDPRRTILTAVESLGFSPRSVAQYLNILKDAHLLEHVGPTNGGTWKFLI